MKAGNTLGSRIADFVNSQKGRILHYIRKNLRDTADRDAEDVLQDVILYILESVDPADPIENLAAYIYASIRNRIIDIYRKPKRTVSLDEKNGGENALALSDILSDVRYDTHNEIEKREIMERLYRALDNLPIEQKAVWSAIELEDRHYEELSAIWEEPLGTLLARKHRANNTLRKKLSDLMI